MTTPPKLVIFDCDGILVDSEPTSNRVLHELLCEYGATLTIEQSYGEFVGKNRYAVEDYMARQNLTLPGDWSETYYERTIAALSATCEPIPHIHAVLDALSAANIPFCVASNGTHPKMNATLTKTHLLSSFTGRMYSGYDMAAGKPAPDLFLHAAAQNNTAPEHCVVIEDSPSGFQAAHAANMRCLAYAPAPELPLWNATPFTSTQDLPKHLGLAI